MKTNFKRLTVISALTVVIFLALLIGVSFAKDKYADYVWRKKTAAFMTALQKPFAEDTYGGKTPEDTWAMYVEAIKNRDTELASKYFDVEHQQKQLEFLKRETGIDNLDLYITQIANPLYKRNDIEKWLLSKGDRAYYRYEFTSVKTKNVVLRDVNFYLNPLTTVWKILYP